MRREKKDDSVGTALLEAPAMRFGSLGETDIHPRNFQAGRIGGPGREGRERGNLIETTPKPPDAQRAGGI